MVIDTIVAALKAAAGVTALVSTRIYPMQAEAGVAMPYVVVELLAAQPVNHLRGWSGSDANQVLVSVFASTYQDARAVSAAVRAALDAAGGLCEQEGDQDFDAATRMHRLTQQWFMWS